MAKGGKAKRMRGSTTHGRGRKAGRGAGLKGGRGRAGGNKHRFLMLQVTGGKHAHLAARPWGRHGFHSVSRTPVDIGINVGQVLERFPDQDEVDLTASGFTKLLGGGVVRRPVTVKVAKATPKAREKVESAGGKLVLPE